MGIATVKDLSELLKDENYSKYNDKKQKIKLKYPPQIFPDYQEPDKRLHQRPVTEEHRILYKKYLKEIGDLLFKPNGHYQKFSWDYLTSSRMKLDMDYKARGRKSGIISY